MEIKCKGCKNTLPHYTKLKILPNGNQRWELSFPSEANGCPKCGNIEYTIEGEVGETLQ